MWKKISFYLMVVVLLTSSLVLAGFISPRLIPANVFMEGVDISNLTFEEAEKKVKEEFVEIYFTSENYHCSFTPEEIGIKINYEESFKVFQNRNLRELIALNFEKTELYLQKSFDMAKMDQFLHILSEEINVPSQDATGEFINGEFVIIPEKAGKKVNTGLLKEMLTAQVLKKCYSIPIEKEEPKLKSKELEKLKPDTLLGEYTTKFVEIYNRTENIKLACQALKNTLILSGEIFSFNDTVGPRDAEKGYLNAMIISGGKFVPGLGGGVCQVSSTLYNAVLLADLEVIERHPHSLQIDYVPPGKDAAVSYGLKDFKFKNNTPGILLLDYEIKGNYLTIRIYGLSVSAQ